MIKDCLPKVGIKLLKNILCQNIIPCFLTFCSNDHPYSVFKILIFKYSSLFTFYSIQAKITS